MNNTCWVCSNRLEYLHKPTYLIKSKQFKKWAMVEQHEDYDIEPFYICSICGLVLRPNDYTPLEKEKIANRDKLVDKDLLMQTYDNHMHYRNKEKFKKRYRWIENHCKFDDLLDVGCEYGFLVKYFDEKGYNATGIDPNKNTAEIGCEKMGLKLIIGYYTEESFPENSFDLITAESVLYYFPELFFRSVCKHLRKGGYLYAHVPDTLNVSGNFFPNYARALFPYENIERIMFHLGFSLIAKNKEFYSNGSYGFIAKYDGTPEIKKPVTNMHLDIETVRKQVLLADYQVTPNRQKTPLLLIQNILLFLHKIQPGGYMPSFFVRGVNLLQKKGLL